MARRLGNHNGGAGSRGKNPSSSIGSSENQGTQGNVAANVGGNQIGTQNNYFHRKDSPVESQSQRNPTQQILLDSVDQEVNSRLIHSLHNRILINLEKEEDPNQVRPPWSVDVKIGSQEPFP